MQVDFLLYYIYYTNVTVICVNNTLGCTSLRMIEP